jgi:hypothetical protein
MTCCGKYWNSPIITNIVKRENMITTSGSAKRTEQYEDMVERVYDAGFIRDETHNREVSPKAQA